MEEDHQLFGWANLTFYDTPSRWVEPATEFKVSSKPIPQGWIRTYEDMWTVLRPAEVSPPSQGWKIHLSARMDNAPQALEIVWEYCVMRDLPFKYLRDSNMHLVLNSKYAPRQSSGKLAAIYPADEEQCGGILEELSPLLQAEGGQAGSYILSDLRWGKGPLFVRYGGFRNTRTLNADGELVLALVRPDGALVQDHRKPVFSPPGWVQIPEFLRPALEAARESDTVDFPYEVKKAIHFSNGGGVYLAERRSDGISVILKEARPNAGLDRLGQDAISRLRRERRVLEHLSDVSGVPNVDGYFTVWEHEFLAMELMPGDPLFVWAGRSHALLQPDPSDQDIEKYTHDALALLDRVGELLEDIHRQGIFFGDLHPGNVLVDADGTVSFIDFETAFWQEESYRPAMGAQGFAAPWCRTGEEMDRYAFASLRLWAFLPVNRIFPLGPRKVAETAAAVAERFALPTGFTTGVLQDMGVEEGRSEHVPPGLPANLVAQRRRVLGQPLDVDLDTESPDWRAVRTSLAEAIRLSATPERIDQLYPGDVRQFRHGPTSFAYGAAGVLWALAATGAPPSLEHEQWLLDAVSRGLPEQPGFYTGRHGTAYALDKLGHHDVARAVVSESLPLTEHTHGMSLFSGLSGIGLNLLYFEGRYGDTAARLEVRKIAKRLAESVRSGRTSGTEKRAGLMHGWSGPALFFLRLYESTGDREHLAMARAALDHDLAECVTLDNGTSQVLESGRRTLAYLESGSAGIGLVSDEILAHGEDQRLSATVREIIAACRTELVAESHLFNGRAGLLATVARLRHHVPLDDAEAVVRRHLRRFSWLALSYRGRLAFPGDQSLRLSMDLATGNAGVLLGIATALEEPSEFLPFFRPQKP
ncbi:class III lanthionine synthetase LanKC [Streptomyces sp. NBC_00690]|uniref:class III lanthionine synthetase LanKC n=1 Tax=Streptomyces sp. NBC_00690 TaxID=2975808 RepID=UPI002E298642|nr:class III lanthionine synthetase LanKC [Streptomyces sp. NBC_00690]